MSTITKQSFLFDVKEKLSEDMNQFDMAIVINKLMGVLDCYDVECVKNEKITDYHNYLNCFLDSKQVEGRSKKTLERYAYILNRFFKETGVSIENVTVFHLRNYMANEKQRGISNRTLNGMRSVFNAFFGWLWKEGLLQYNPCANLSVVKCAQKVRVPYSDIDIEKLKENCDCVRDKALISFLLCTGCRISEVCNLNRDNINFERKECKVLGKGNKERIVYLNDVTCMLLERYLKERKDDLDALFIGKRLERLSAGGVRSKLKVIAEKAGVENVHPHRFRRTLATNLINHGMTIQEVATILGHEKIDTTMKYIYINNEDVKISYNKFSF